jgi:sugar phosphate permease
MVACELVQAALLVVIAVAVPSLPLLLVLVGLRAWAGQVFQPASRASIPALVSGPGPGVCQLHAGLRRERR